MAVLSIKCFCGEQFKYEIDENSLKLEFERMGIVPILVPHKDHFVTVYVDSNLTVRSVERVVLVKDAKSSVVVKAGVKGEGIFQIIEDIKKKYDPFHKYTLFISQLLTKVNDPENLFTAGREVGKYIWNKRREPLLKMGASFKISPDLLLNNEIIPCFEKVGNVEIVKGKDTIIIKNAISPAFTVGIAQGILDAIQSYMQSRIHIKIEYIVSGSTVFLTLREAEI